MGKKLFKPVFPGWVFLCLTVFFLWPPGAPPALADDMAVLYDDAAARTVGGLQNLPAFWVEGSSAYSLYPGTDNDPSASGNTVTMDCAIDTGYYYPFYVLGGLSVSEDAENNKVVIKNGLVVYNAPAWQGGFVIGGYSVIGDVANNSVELSGETKIGDQSFRGFVFGGLSGEGGGSVHGNRIEMFGNSSAAGAVYGGATFYVDNSNEAEAHGNSVVIHGNAKVTATEDPDNLGAVAGGATADGGVHGNSVEIYENAVIEIDVIGGVAWEYGQASDNGVTIYGDAVTKAIYGGKSNGLADGNSVKIYGNATADTIYGGSGGDGANNNRVEIYGNATVTGGVVGGFTSSGTAVSNSVSIKDTPSFSEETILIGGYSEQGGDSFSDNTLNLHVAGLRVGLLENFQYLNFYVPGDLAAGGIMLAAQTSNITGSTVNVGIEGGSSPLRPGDSIVLIDSSEGELTGTPENSQANGNGMQGVTLLYDFNLSVRDNQLLATIEGASVNPQTGALPEGRAAGQAFLNQGGDLIIGPGLEHILAATRGSGPGGPVPFAAAQGGWNRYQTGSHIDVSGASFLAGLAWRQPLDDHGSDILAGAFFEAGRGGYDSHNSFTGYPAVKANGDINYYGGGVLARYGHSSGVYLDASLRAGRVKTDFRSSDLRDASGRKAEYDSSSAYYGAHAGLGYIWDITDKASLDLSTRYIWTRQEGDTVKVAGDPVKFKSSDSQRWRTGGRLAYAVNEYLSPYAGAYYEHEFDGKVRASTNDYSLDSPNLKGGTGIGEIGLSLKPLADSRFSLDLGVQGYVGERRGVTGSLQLKFEF